MVSPQFRAARTAVLVLASYAAVGLVDGLLFHNAYHENALVLVIAMGVLVFSAPPPHWRIALSGCVALALLNAVLAWTIGQAGGLDEQLSFAHLLRNAVRAGLLA